MIREFIFKQKKTGNQLTDEKNKDYRNVVVLQILIIFSALLMKDIFAISGMEVETSYKLRDSLFLLLGGIYVLVLWDTLRNFTENKFIIASLFIIIMGTYVLTLVTVNPFFKMFDTEAEQRPYLFFIHMILFIVEATVIYFTILDIFTGNKLSNEKLWGSACIFLMIGISFGSVYDLINIASPGCMGVPVKLGLDSYTTCIFYSMTIIGGHDAFPDAIPLITNIGIIEAVWSNLFIVLLVGRILGKPEEEKEKA